MDLRIGNVEGSSAVRGRSGLLSAGRELLRRRGASNFVSLRSGLFVAAVSAAAVAAFVIPSRRGSVRPGAVSPALLARSEVAPVTTFRSHFELPVAVASGRLIRVFGSLPPRAMCRNAHWQWADLSQQWFAGADCTDAQLQSAKLIGTNFRGANLSGAQMQDAMMWYVNLNFARLFKANLRHADVARGSLRQASLEGADLRRAIFKAANLTQANLLGANLREANFTAANLQGAVLTGLVMDGVDFTRANLAGADLGGADLRKAIGLTAAQLKLANTDSRTLMPPGMAAAAALSLTSPPVPASQ